MDPATSAKLNKNCLGLPQIQKTLTLNGEEGVFNDLSIPANHQPNQWLVLSPDLVEKKPMSSLLLVEGGQIPHPLEEQAAEFYGRLILDRFWYRLGCDEMRQKDGLQ